MINDTVADFATMEDTVEPFDHLALPKKILRAVGLAVAGRPRFAEIGVRTRLPGEDRVKADATHAQLARVKRPRADEELDERAGIGVAELAGKRRFLGQCHHLLAPRIPFRCIGCHGPAAVAQPPHAVLAQQPLLGADESRALGVGDARMPKIGTRPIARLQRQMHINASAVLPVFLEMLLSSSNTLAAFKFFPDERLTGDGRWARREINPPVASLGWYGLGRRGNQAEADVSHTIECDGCVNEPKARFNHIAFMLDHGGFVWIRQRPITARLT